MPLSKLEKKQYCSGCHDDYYNHGNNSNTKECWLLKSAKLITAYRIGWWTPQDKARNFTECKTLNCHKEPGSTAFYSSIPDHLKSEWNELQKDKRNI